MGKSPCRKHLVRRGLRKGFRWEKMLFIKTTKSCLIKGLITLSYNVYTFWMDTVFFFLFFLFFCFFFVFFCFCLFLFSFLFLFFFFFVFPFLLPCYKGNHQPPSSFSAIHVRYTCIMTVINILFLKPTTPEGCDGPIKVQQMPGPKQNFDRKTGEAKSEPGQARTNRKQTSQNSQK